MNLEHLRTFFWLRSRLLINQLARGGIVNAVFIALAGIVCVFLSINLFIGAFLVGWLAFDDAPSFVILLVWDGIVIIFTFTWMIGLLTELQRSEALSLEKFLHLPVSPAGVFGLNYLASLMSVNLLMFVPLMIGLTLGLAAARGPALLVLLPLLLAFILMVTALTYQFQGWLVSLMTNQRRRRTVIVVVTLVFILMFQLPNAIGLMAIRDRPEIDFDLQKKELEVIQHAYDNKQITDEEYFKRKQENVNAHYQRIREADQRFKDEALGYAALANTVLPLGWLPLGAQNAFDGDVLPALLGLAAYTLIGGLSLLRAYRTTLRLYTGHFTSGAPSSPRPSEGEGAGVRGQPASATSPSVREPATLLDRKIPWLSEQVSAVALGGFRSIVRAPEAKMLLITPLIMFIAFGAMVFQRAATDEVPEFVRPLIAIGAMNTIMITLTQFIGNQFGFDSGGFRIYVLSPAPRRDVLLGKNLAVAPIALVMAVVAASLVQILMPMRVYLFLALLPQMVTMFLTFAIFGNFLAIYAPMPIQPGGMKAANTQLLPVLLNFTFMIGYTTTIAITLLPLAIEAIFDLLDLIVPLYLPMSVAVCAGVILIYRRVLVWQGAILQTREQAILDVVTVKAE